MSMAARRDYAVAAAAALLTGPSGPVTTHELGGESRTLAELAEIISDVTGSEIRYRNMNASDFADALTASGMPPEIATMSAAIDASISGGALEVDEGELVQLIGRSLTPLRQLVTEAFDRIAGVANVMSSYSRQQPATWVTSDSAE